MTNPLGGRKKAGNPRPSAATGAEEELLEVGRLISSAPLEHEPPADLEERVLALVELDEAARLIASAPLEADPPLELERKSLLWAGAALPGRRGRVASLLAPGLAAAAVTFGVLGMNWHSDAEHWRRQISAVHTQLGSLGTPMGNIVVSPRAATGGSAVGGELVKLDHGYRLLLDTSRLPVTHPGYSYELWLAGPSGRTPAGSFTKTRGGEETLAFMVGVDPEDYPELEIRLERDNGNPRPTGDKVMEGRLLAGRHD